jgi:hypothetical protein
MRVEAGHRASAEASLRNLIDITHTANRAQYYLMAHLSETKPPKTKLFGAPLAAGVAQEV